MFRSKKRRIVTPVKQQDPSTLLREHVIKQTDAKNMLVSEYDVTERQRPISFWMRDLHIPLWLLLILVSLAIILYTAFAIFTSIVTLQKSTNGGACRSNSDCRTDLGLLCNNYRCGCAYSHFWSDSYDICERRRMINRTCVNDSMCDILANLQCDNVSLASGGIQAQCQCKASMSWNGYTCVYQSLYNTSCLIDANCDSTRFLFCNVTLQLCRCNSSMFWNGNTANSGTCEYKRTVDQYCYPYNDNWCDDTGPVGQGLVCSQYANPYGSEYGVCQCSTHDYYNGSAALGNGYCVPQHVYGESCTSTSQCDYRIGLTCINNLCLCASDQSYDAAINSGGVNGSCVPAAGYLQNCSAILQCSASVNLYCDFSYYGGLNLTGICLCNNSWSFWDGLTCADKLTIGGACTDDTECMASADLFCSNYTQSIGTCDCDKNHFWNSTCIIKQWYNTSCSSSYVCDDNRGLQCQGLGGSMFEKCDCYNETYIWDSLYINRSDTCILRLTNGQSTCYGDLECQVYNYLQCNSGTCGCSSINYWDGARCQVKRNYTDPCSNTTECRDFNPVDLICRLGSTVPQTLQCLCNITSFWDDCLQACVTTKEYQQPCTLVSNCSSNECDILANLQCLNNSATGSGWCNCTVLQWWNGTYCRDKGIPSWGVNSSAICNATYQCADYNLVSCPLGGNYPSINSTCECATTKYWNGYTCLDRVVYGQPCTLWPISPVSTSTCLSAAGAGLICNSSTCFGGTNCTGGVCYCPTGTVWNTTFLICASTTTG